MHSDTFLREAALIAERMRRDQIESMADALGKVKGRIYCLGLGGSLTNAMHMAADFRKLCHLDAWALDNPAELTAWANDEGIERIFSGIRQKLSRDDALFILSVGGGRELVSPGISMALAWARACGAVVFGIVGPDGGDTHKYGDYVIRIPAAEPHITPHTEAFQAVIWHCLVSHPNLQKAKTKW